MKIFSDSFEETPFWGRDAATDDGLPHQQFRNADFLVVGADLIGLNAATTLAKAGNDVAVVDAITIGESAITRNGGQIRSECKVAYRKLAELPWAAVAAGIRDHFAAARSFLPELIRELCIACYYQWLGFSFGVHTRRDPQMKIARHQASITSGRGPGDVVPICGL